MVALTIGMATYKDFDGVYFTLQALRLYQDLKDTELLVVDNYGCEHTQQFVEGWANGRYIRATEAVGTAAPRDLVFREARGEAVLCCDSHILFAPDAIKRLKKYYRKHPECIDLLQGPLLYDDLHNLSTHFDPVWREQMWGIWATDARGSDKHEKPFEIPMQGLGIFSCRREVWPGFNEAFRGFGGEEGYIHEKFRQRGGRCLCLPWLRWVHRFSRPSGVPYPLTVQDKLWNYLIGHMELGLDIAPVLEHFAAHLPPETVATVQAEALRVGTSGAKKTTHVSATPNLSTTLPTTGGEGPQPLVSCVCPTYNRVPHQQHLLEEAIESFLRQTYPNKELIIINDCPEQELICDVPGVRVVNLPERLPSLGDKRNVGVQLARGELIAPWDDDDISLPWRLSHSVERLGDADYYNPKSMWFMDHHGLHPDYPGAVGFNMSLYRRSAWQTVGGHASITLGDDLDLDQKFRAAVRCIGEPRAGQEVWPRQERYYIYRWGISQLHLSTAADSWDKMGELPIQPGRFILHPHWRSDYQAETRKLLETVEPITLASVDMHPLTEDTSPISTDTGRSVTDHRAIVCFVEDNSHLIQQLLALRLSWLQTDSPDTDLVVIGPEDVLMRLPDDLVKIAQQPAAADPVWGGYRYVNAIASLNGSGAEQLDRYSHILRTDVDTFITPAWNEFYPETFTVGIGSYATEEDVQQRIRDIATEYGLNHRGMTDVGASWYGPTDVVRRAAALAEMLTKHLLTHDFADDPGQWPGWYRGVAMKYASEIAVNHCAPGAKRSELLDASSTSDESITRYPHIHCVHTDKKFSKHAFMEGRYRRKHMKDLEMDIIKDYCLGLSMRSLEALTSVR